VDRREDARGLDEKLYFPPPSLQNVKSGDSVTVELAMTSATPKAK